MNSALQMEQDNPLLTRYSVVKNENDALAFITEKNRHLDFNGAGGPFWFRMVGESIMVGTKAHRTVFSGVSPDVIDLAQQRKVIMLMETEGDRVVRVTPCYLSS